MADYFTIKPLGSEVVDSSIVGNKAHQLMKLSSLGLGSSIPPGFVLSTAFCHKGFDPATNTIKLRSFIRWLASEAGKTWNTETGSPLLVSVRSGAPVSMPGMMDTVLNVGLNSTNISQFHDQRFALDAFRRLISSFAVAVDGVSSSLFKELVDAAKLYFGDLNSVEACEVLVKRYLEVYEKEVGRAFPEDIETQLLESIQAVFNSWHSPRAKEYRAIEGISDSIGTAALVQAMVFGNLNSDSGTGVVFSHSPLTGKAELYGDYLVNAQGEDVVNGTHKTTPIHKLKGDNPRLFETLNETINCLLGHFEHPLDVEFTVENGKVWILQTREAKLPLKARLGSILDDFSKGTIGFHAAHRKLVELTGASSSPEEESWTNLVASGIGTGNGICTGAIALSKEAAQKAIDDGTPFVYIAPETSPDDVAFMSKAEGILTAKGGAVSHAAVIAMAWGKPAIVGCEALVFTEESVMLNNIKLSDGMKIKLNADEGTIWL